MISWQKEKTETIFKWKLWIRRILQSAAKNCVKPLKSWTRQFSHASGFLLSMVLRLWFSRTGLSIFQRDISILSGAHYHSSIIIFCVSQVRERWYVLWCVHRDGALQKNLWLCLAQSQNHSSVSLPRSSLLSFYFFFSQIWFYVPTSVHIFNFSFQVSLLSGHLGKASKRKCVTSS